MTTDFKATQVQTNKIIVTGSFAGDGSNQLLIYNYAADDSGSPNQGQIDPTKFDTSSGIGSDVFLFVSGGVATRGTGASYGVTVMGGDLHVSGNLTVDGTSPGGGGGGGGPQYWFGGNDDPGNPRPAGVIITTGSAEITGSLSQGDEAQASGLFSHAEGFQTISTGDYSHAEGGGTQSPGTGSHAEGIFTISSGIVSHAEGVGTIASATGSHAEGESTIASGDYSHAEGYASEATGSYSRAAGRSTFASGEASHAEGYFTISSTNFSHAEGLNTVSAGTGSHAEGESTQTVGNASHAEGDQTIAQGNHSHSEGFQTLALGNNSHAEGAFTTGSGIASHAEGGFTNATGDASHAEGAYTVSAGIFSHAEGSGSIAYGSGSHAGGAFTIASGTAQTVIGFYNQRNNDFSLFVIGDGTGDANANRSDIVRVNSGTLPGSGSFEVTGTVRSTLGFSGSLTRLTNGSSYLVAGTNVTITSASNGQVTISSTGGGGGGTNFWFERYLDQIYTTGSVEITGSFTQGEPGNIAGVLAHAEGYLTIASGDYSHAEGGSTTAPGYSSHAEGALTKASGGSSHAEGYLTTASGDYSHSEGAGTHAVGFGSHAEGDNTRAAESCHAEGQRTTASYYFSHAEGSFTYAEGEASHAEGRRTYAGGYFSHAEGYFATSSFGANYSHSEGVRTVAGTPDTFSPLWGNEGMHSEGYFTNAYGNYSHAEGSGTFAIGNASHAGGANTISSGTAQTVYGKYNQRNNNFSLFVIGDGTGDSNANRSDIVRVNSGTLPGSGSFEVTGTVRATLGFSGSLTRLTDGSSYLVAGTNVTITSASNGQITISSTSGGGGGSEFWQSTTANQIFNTGSLVSTSGSFRALFLSSSTGAAITGTLRIAGASSGIIVTGSTTVDGALVNSVFHDPDTAGNSYGLVVRSPGTGFGSALISLVAGTNISSANYVGGILGCTFTNSGLIPGVNIAAGASYPTVGVRIGSNNMARFNANGLQVTGTIQASSIVRASNIITNGSTTADGALVSNVFEDSDTSGNSYGLVVKSPGTSFGVPSLSFIMGSTVSAANLVGGAVGSTATGFGLIPGFNLSAYAAYPNVGVRIAGNNMARFNAAGLQVTGTIQASSRIVAQTLSSSAGGEIIGSLTVSGTSASNSTFTAYTGVRYFPDVVTTLPFTASLTDYIIAVSSSNPTAATNYGVELPGAEFGRTFVVKDISGSAASSNITVTAAGSSDLQRSIDGASSYVISINRGSATFVYFGDTRGWGVI